MMIVVFIVHSLLVSTTNTTITTTIKKCLASVMEPASNVPIRAPRDYTTHDLHPKEAEPQEAHSCMRKDLAQDEAQEHQYDGCAFTTAICPGLEEEEEDSIQRILGGGGPTDRTPTKRSRQ